MQEIKNKIICGDSGEVLKDFDDNCIDSLVTDPPYGINFMAKKWDYDIPKKEFWAECLRVLKPGAHALIFGGTRTFHRLVVEIEDAGFEIRDTVVWHYAEGFPKNMDVSKQIDKQAGAKREVIGESNINVYKDNYSYSMANNFADKSKGYDKGKITVPVTEEAKKWDGWGTALKPATELICLCRKPISEKTIAANILKWGCGGINIDGSRINAKNRPLLKNKGGKSVKCYGNGLHGSKAIGKTDLGRWPANVIFDEHQAAELDRQSGERPVGEKGPHVQKNTERFNSCKISTSVNSQSTGKASRFFFISKPSKAEKNVLCENVEKANSHPTCKPIKLMKYLINMITQPSGIVLDPFLGSGTTAIAARELGFNFVGIEKDEDYVIIAKARLRQGYLF